MYHSVAAVLLEGCIDKQFFFCFGFVLICFAEITAHTIKCPQNHYGNCNRQDHVNKAASTGPLNALIPKYIAVVKTSTIMQHRG